MDDDVEVAPIHRHGGMACQPVRPHRNHDLHIEQVVDRPESHC